MGEESLGKREVLLLYKEEVEERMKGRGVPRDVGGVVVPQGC